MVGSLEILFSRSRNDLRFLKIPDLTYFAAAGCLGLNSADEALESDLIFKPDDQLWLTAVYFSDYGAGRVTNSTVLHNPVFYAAARITESGITATRREPSLGAP